MHTMFHCPPPRPPPWVGWTLPSTAMVPNLAPRPLLLLPSLLREMGGIGKPAAKWGGMGSIHCIVLCQPIPTLACHHVGHFQSPRRGRVKQASLQAQAHPGRNVQTLLRLVLGVRWNKCKCTDMEGGVAERGVASSKMWTSNTTEQTR